MPARPASTGRRFAHGLCLACGATWSLNDWTPQRIPPAIAPGEQAVAAAAMQRRR